MDYYILRIKMFIPPQNRGFNIPPYLALLKVVISNNCPKLNFFRKISMISYLFNMVIPKVCLNNAQLRFKNIITLLKINISSNNCPKLKNSILSERLFIRFTKEFWLHAFNHFKGKSIFFVRLELLNPKWWSWMLSVLFVWH